MNLRQVSYQDKVNRTGSLSCLMAVTGISGIEFTDNGAESYMVNLMFIGPCVILIFE